MESVGIEFYGKLALLIGRYREFNGVVIYFCMDDSVFGRSDVDSGERLPVKFVHPYLYRSVKRIYEIGESHCVPEFLRIVPVIPNLAVVRRRVRT